ncbi:hypothetical protein JCM18899A_53990 [Nocardioides sp. AN3]
MNWHVITVPRSDLGLALGAIRWGGGTVTSTKLAGPDVAITYVTEVISSVVHDILAGTGSHVDEPKAS